MISSYKCFYLTIYLTHWAYVSYPYRLSFCRLRRLDVGHNSMESSPQQTLILDFLKDKWCDLQVTKRELKEFRLVGRSLAAVHGKFRDMNQEWTKKGKNKAPVKAVQAALEQNAGILEETLEAHNVSCDNLGFRLQLNARQLHDGCARGLELLEGEMGDELSSIREWYAGGGVFVEADLDDVIGAAAAPEPFVPRSQRRPPGVGRAAGVGMNVKVVEPVLPSALTSPVDWEVCPIEAHGLPSTPLPAPDHALGPAPLPYMHVEDEEGDEQQLLRRRPCHGMRFVCLLFVVCL